MRTTTHLRAGEGSSINPDGGGAMDPNGGGSS